MNNNSIHVADTLQHSSPFLHPTHSYGTASGWPTLLLCVGNRQKQHLLSYPCDPSKINLRPKDKDKVDAASVISELDPFITCALQLALFDKD